MLISGRGYRAVSSGCNTMRVLEAFDLYRFYHIGDEETLALRGVSIHVDAGELVVVMGPSGSGKSTLLSCLVGLDEPDGGYVELIGKRLTRRPEAERAARRAAEIGILLQSRNLFDQLSVSDNMRLQMRLARKLDERRLRELIELVGLQDRRNARPSQLSGGEAARAALAVALSTDPKILLADEPTGEVDTVTEAHMLRLLETRRNAGGATLIATHSDALASHADRIVHIFDGRVVNA
jgi:putative ABC transport system ATP-binding protein